MNKDTQTQNRANAQNTDPEGARQARSQADDILFAMQWMGGNKLFGIKHVKGREWKQ